MIYSSTLEALKATTGALGESLVAAGTSRKLAAFAARYPDLGQTQYLECRLGDSCSPQVDLLISAASTLERTSLGRQLSAHPGEDPVLWPIQRFVAAWASPTSILHASVPVAWLEFDHMECDDNPIANLGVCLAPAYLDPFADLPAQSADGMLDVILESLRVVDRRPPAEDDRFAFHQCLHHLPPGARWIHLSIMAARTPVELKLYGTFRPDAVLPYLDAVGWRGDRAAIARLLQRYCPDDRTAGLLYVDLPVTGMFDPERAGLGIVFAQQQLRSARERDGQRRALVQTLVDDGLCTPAQAWALTTWPGAAPAAPYQVHRWFDIKIAWRAGQPLLAKAYLGFAAVDDGNDGAGPAASNRSDASTSGVAGPSPLS